MADEQASRPKPSAWFTRYEFVAVAIPGAVFLFGLFAFAAKLTTLGVRLDSAKIAFEKVDIGGFGLFAVAAFCAGQIIQAVAAFCEWLIVEASLAGWKTQVSVVPEYLRDRYASRLRKLGIAEPLEVSRRTYRRQVLPFVLARLYRVGITERLADVRVSSGFHRGLAATFSLLAVIFAFGKQPWATAVLAVGAGIMFANACRYHRQFYRQLAFEYMDLDDRALS